MQVTPRLDVDVNNNAANPVINERSYGEDRANVTAKAFQYMMGLQDGGVLACAKHASPGHGDTNTDSHSRPCRSSRTTAIGSTASSCSPFRALASGRRVGHGGALECASIGQPREPPDDVEPADDSKLLREQIGFEGLIFTDAMEMQAVTKYRC